MHVTMHHCHIISGIIKKSSSCLLCRLLFFCRINVTHLIYTASHLFRRAIKNFAQRFLYGDYRENLWSPSKNKFTNLSSLVYLESKAPAGIAYSEINPDSTLQRNRGVLRLMQTMVMMFCRIITFFRFFYFTIAYFSFPFYYFVHGENFLLYFIAKFTTNFIMW